MSVSAVGTVLDALRAALILRAGLSDVNVYSGPVSVDEAGLECIAFGDAKLDQEASTMGGGIFEEWSIEGETRVCAVWAGDVEATIKAARDRALALLAELETHVNDTYTGQLPDVEVAEGAMRPEYDTTGRICWVQFDLRVRFAKNP